MRCALLVTLLATVMLGCSSTKCAPDQVIGNYELRVGEDQYELHLVKGGTGELLHNQAKIGAIKWEVESATEQVFLEAASDVLEVLRKISNGSPPPNDIAKTRSGYFGVTPQCRSTNSVERLDLDVDGQRFFLRMK